MLMTAYYGRHGRWLLLLLLLQLICGLNIPGTSASGKHERRSRNTEARLKRRIEHGANEPVHKHLPILSSFEQVIALLAAYGVCLLVLFISIVLIMIYDKTVSSQFRRVWRLFYYCCCCCCCCSVRRRRRGKRSTGASLDDDDDAHDSDTRRRGCFQRQRGGRFSVFSRKSYASVFSSLHSIRKSVSADRQKPKDTTASLNFQLKDQSLKVRLEFLNDLAAYMSMKSVAVGRLASESMEGDSSTSIEVTPHQLQRGPANRNTYSGATINDEQTFRSD